MPLGSHLIKKALKEYRGQSKFIPLFLFIHFDLEIFSIIQPRDQSRFSAHIVVAYVLTCLSISTRVL